MVGIRMVKLRALIKLMRATIQKVERMGWQIREVYVRIAHCWGRLIKSFIEFACAINEGVE
jgi:hypothetical protein